MKNILDTLGGALGKGGLGNALGGLGNLGNLGGLGNLGNLGGVGDTLNNAMGKAKGGLGQIPTDKLNLGGMLGSAAIGGLLGALFTGKGVGKVAKGALVAGGTAAAGALAWKFYQKWSQNQVTAETISVPGQTSPSVGQAAPASAPSGWPAALEQEAQAALPPAENTALLLLESMIFAARADGHIDEEEKAHIQNAVGALFPGQEMNALLEHMLTKPIDPSALAARIQNPEEAHDLYRLSCTAVHVDNFMERSYLDGLAQALSIGAPEKAQLEREAEEARREAALA